MNLLPSISVIVYQPMYYQEQRNRTFLGKEEPEELLFVYRIKLDMGTAASSFDQIVDSVVFWHW